jgi:hypothetical protein
MSSRGSRAGLALLAVAVALCAGPAASGASLAPGRLLHAMLSAAARQQTVHYVLRSTLGGSVITQVADVGARQGIQRITYRRGGATGTLTVLVTPQGAFVRGDSLTLAAYMGFKLIQATADSGAWLFVPRGTPDYAPVAAAVTLPSFLAELRLLGPLAPAPAARLRGRSLAGVEGREPPASGQSALARLYPGSAAVPLPLEELVGHAGATMTITLSRWNEPLRVAVPPHSRPISALVFA